MSLTPAGGIIEGGTYTFRLHATLDGEVWDLTDAVVTLIFKPHDFPSFVRGAIVIDPIHGIAEYTTEPFDLVNGTYSIAWKIEQGETILESMPDVFTVNKSLLSYTEVVEEPELHRLRKS